MIFFSAFEKYEKKYFSYEEKFHIEEEIQLDINLIFPMIERFAKNRGFEKVWFSDKRHLILVKSNMTMHLIRGMVINGRILGNDKKEYYLGFGAGTSIKRREIGFLDTLDSRMKNQDDLRFKMIALAIRDNDLEMLSTLFMQKRFRYCILLTRYNIGH